MTRSIFEIQAEFCKAMGNATRLKIMHMLRESPMTVSEIMDATGLGQSLISRQLSVLRSVGVVTNERNGVERSIGWQMKKSRKCVTWFNRSCWSSSSSNPAF